MDLDARSDIQMRFVLASGFRAEASGYLNSAEAFFYLCDTKLKPSSNEN